LETFKKKGTEIKRIDKKTCIVLVILAIVTLLFIFTKVHDRQAGEGTSVSEANKQNNTELKDINPTPEISVLDSTEDMASTADEEDGTTSGASMQNSTEDMAATAATADTGSSTASESNVNGGFDSRVVTFDLAHAISVGESIHLPENGDLEWQGNIVHHKGGTLGAYEEAVNIFNGTDYHIYEVYNVLVRAHPELKTDHLEPYECPDINNFYGFTVSRAPSEINEIDNALREGKLVQLQVHSNMWRNAEGELVDWPGFHSGLIFYFDGSLYHMKAAGSINQKNAVYTREQIIDWIGGTSKQLVIYTKHSN
jgi:hypothetical protein